MLDADDSDDEDNDEDNSDEEEEETPKKVGLHLRNFLSVNTKLILDFTIRKPPPIATGWKC